MKSKIPKYKITIDELYQDGQDELGIRQIAYTKTPAILTKGMAFSSQSPKIMMFSDATKLRIAAPIMVPMDIYRCESDEEYYVQFTSEEIEIIYKKFMSGLTNKSVFNLEHDPSKEVPAYLLEAVLVDSEAKRTMLLQEYSVDVPLGSVFLVTQLTDAAYYQELVDSGCTGFSIEGFLGMKLSEHKFADTPPFHEDCKCFISGERVVSQEGVCEYCQEQADNYENTKLNINTKMEDQIKLPAGEYTAPDGKCYIIAEDGTISLKPVDAELACAPKEEALAVDESPAESVGEAQPEAPAEAAKDAPLSYTKEEIDAKLQEILKIIADMQAEDDVEEAPMGVKPVAMSMQDKVSILSKAMGE